MNILEAIILGIIQGLTEFLPASSSGHLAIMQAIFGLENPDTLLAFDILLHLGTLIAVFIVFWDTIWNLIKSFFTLIRDIFTSKFKFKTAPYYQKMLIYVLIATVPLFILAALKLDDAIATVSLFGVGIALVGTAVILYIADHVVKGKKSAETMTVWDSIFVGLMQGVAIIPGISRSGSTISAGLYRGLDRKFAVEFSFVLSIPAILGAALLKIPDAVSAGIDKALVLPCILGMAAAVICGYFAIILVKKLIKSNKFGFFAYYCLLVGVFTVIYSLCK